jgi:hypothetical protein
MRLRSTIHLASSAIFVALLLANQGRLASVLFVALVAVEILVAAATGKQGNDTQK